MAHKPGEKPGNKKQIERTYILNMKTAGSLPTKAFSLLFSLKTVYHRF